MSSCLGKQNKEEEEESNFLHKPENNFKENQRNALRCKERADRQLVPRPLEIRESYRLKTSWKVVKDKVHETGVELLLLYEINNLFTSILYKIF